MKFYAAGVDYARVYRDVRNAKGRFLIMGGGMKGRQSYFGDVKAEMKTERAGR